jgi:chorismate dehydratase
MKLLIGKIPFLNSEPFYPLLGEHNMVSMPPHELGRLAERGEIDAGIMATADYLRAREHYEPIGNLGIANREEVRSILLFSRTPLEALADTRIGISEQTSTSVRLLRLLLEVRYGVKPRVYERGVREQADAFLVIGNEALRRAHTKPTGFEHRYDLASQWWMWKKLPFVFALWVIRRSLPDPTKTEFAELLQRSFSKGMNELDEVANRHAGELGTPAELVSYLKNFKYRLGEDEMRGLNEFKRLAVQNGLLEPM